MKRKGKFLLTFILTIFALSSCILIKDRLVSIPLKGVRPEMEDARYWTQKLNSPIKSLMSLEEIKQKNYEIRKKEDLYMYDLLNFPDLLSKEEIMEMLEL